MASRMFILHRFLLARQRDSEPMSAPEQQRLWTLLQARPLFLHCGSDDIFCYVYKSMRCVSEWDVNRILEDQTERVRNFFHSSWPLTFWWVMDEAQEPAKQCVNESMAEHGRRPQCPVLLEILKTMMPTAMRLVLSGTALTDDDLEFAQPWFQHRNNVGEFTRASQEAYIRSYVPPGIFTEQAWEALLARAWAWLPGRHCFTAVFVSHLLQSAYRSPHRALDRAIFELSGGATNGCALSALEPPLLTEYEHGRPVLSFASLKDETLWYISTVLLGHCLDLGKGAWIDSSGKVLEMVEHGFAPFTRDMQPRYKSATSRYGLGSRLSSRLSPSQYARLLANLPLFIQEMVTIDEPRSP
ncbi:hypothetical protein BV25DRAFT_1916327 [Artomyces pyxidatus]|uniref:Uncharacterized protein n=1 Tax=Artomyces pyxidatus TaxID=48021 RepID=A0ACB8T1Y1_9AGAM|nr:hypothetical protein BV25DRAFT_1916327 [Artomyces pyxidatus]